MTREDGTNMLDKISDSADRMARLQKFNTLEQLWVTHQDSLQDQIRNEVTTL